MSCTERTTRIKGLKVSYRQEGEGPALVLVHGLLGYSFSWRRIIGRLARTRRVFALDMPGSGLSDCSPALDGRLSAAADRLRQFLDTQNISCCDLVGSSYGGTTSLFFAAKHRERIRTLTLISPANPWSRIGRKRLAMLQVPLISEVFPPAARTMPFLHRLSIRRMYGDPNRVSAETVRGYSLALMRPGVFEHAVRIARNWRTNMNQFEDALPRADGIPTLLIWGSKDRVVDPLSAQTLAARLPGSRLVTIQNAGHLPYEECPEKFVEVLEAFLPHPSSAPVLDGK